MTQINRLAPVSIYKKLILSQFDDIEYNSIKQGDILLQDGRYVVQCQGWIASDSISLSMLDEIELAKEKTDNHDFFVIGDKLDSYPDDPPWATLT